MFFETKTKKLSKNDYFCAIKNMKLPKPSTMNCRYILLFTSVFAFITSKTDVKAPTKFSFFTPDLKPSDTGYLSGFLGVSLDCDGPRCRPVQRL